MQKIINEIVRDMNAAKAHWVGVMKARRINPQLMKDDIVDRQLELKLYERLSYFDLGSIAAFYEWNDHVQRRMDKHLFGEMVVHELCDFKSTTATKGQDAIALQLAEEFKSRTAATHDNLLCMIAIVLRGIS